MTREAPATRPRARTPLSEAHEEVAWSRRSTAEAGAVKSWDVTTAVDGPGTRFVLFTAGCPLRCLYCHNPETWRMRDGQAMTVDAVMELIRPYERFIRVAGGGVTISGGEPLLQAPFAAAVLHRCRQAGLHTALDTSGYLGARASDSLLDDTDLVLLDVKSWDLATYRLLTGGALGPTLAFARRLARRGNRMWVRFVLVPGVTDDPANIEGVAAFTATLGTVDRVEVLAFHRMAATKYRSLGLPYPLADTAPPTLAALDAARAIFRAHGLNVP